MSKEIELMNKTVKCLALELPESVWEDVNKNWQSVLRSLPPTEGPNSISNESIPNGMVSKEELVDRFAEILFNEDTTFKIMNLQNKYCVSVALQYHQSKLEELERWIDTDCNWLQVSTIKSLKAKIKSL